MASIIRTSLAMGWDGKAAENGLAKMATTVDASGKKVTELGKDMSSTAKAASEAAKENERFAKSLEKMNALEQRNAIAQRATKQRRMGMTAKQVQADIEMEKKKADRKAAQEEWSKKSLFQKAASVTSGATDIASFAGMAVGAGNAVLSFAKLGGALETLQIKATYMAGSFKAGVAAIEEMRDASMASGVALADNVKGMNALATAGFSVKASTDTVKSLQNAQ